MTKSLMDIVAEQRAQPSVAQETTRLLAAKSGKDTSGLTAAPLVETSIAEDSAREQGLTQLNQLVQEGAVAQAAQAQQIAAQNQQFQDQRTGLQQARQSSDVERKLRTEGLLNNLERQKSQLSFDQKASMMEQVGFDLALQDKKYVDELRDAGRRQRLDTKLGFNKEMQDLTFSTNTEFFKNKLLNDDILAASDRDFRNAINQMSIKDAYDIFARESQTKWEDANGAKYQMGADYRQSQRDKANAAIWNALGQATSIGTEAYSAQQANNRQEYEDEVRLGQYSGTYKDWQNREEPSQGSSDPGSFNRMS